MKNYKGKTCCSVTTALHGQVACWCFHEMTTIVSLSFSVVPFDILLNALPKNPRTIKRNPVVAMLALRVIKRNPVVAVFALR